jgi:hypothetical protein
MVISVKAMKILVAEAASYTLNQRTMSGQMSFADFLCSIEQEKAPSPQLGQALAALWQDRRGRWEIAHSLAQEAGGKDGAWVHAYLHRKEGDDTNAAYWYRLAGRPASRTDLADEWQQIVRTLLGE